MVLQNMVFLDYDDFCTLCAATVEQEIVGGIINICSGVPQTLADRTEQFIKDNHFKIRFNYGAFPNGPYDSKALWGNRSKIKSIMEKRNEKK